MDAFTGTFRHNKFPSVVRIACLAILISHFYSCSVRGDIVFDASADFSTTNNPNGVWSSGLKLSLGTSVLNVFDLNDGNTPLNSWHLGSASSLPTFGKNIGAVVDEGILPGQVFMHPGEAPGVNELATLRFTAPLSGGYVLQSQFFNGNTGETMGYVYLNGVEQFSSLTSVNPVFNSSLSLTAGDHVEFIVGASDDGHIADATALSVNFTLTAVPEPSSFILLLSVVGGILVRLRRRNILFLIQSLAAQLPERIQGPDTTPCTTPTPTQS